MLFPAAMWNLQDPFTAHDTAFGEHSDRAFTQEAS